MATWEDGPEYAPLVRPDAFMEPTTSPLSIAPAVEQPAATAPKERPAFADPAGPVAPLESLVPPVDAPRDPAEPFAVVTTALTSGDSAWGAAHWARPSGPAPGPWAPSSPVEGASPETAASEPLIPVAGPPLTANGFPAPGTTAWFTPPPLPPPARSTSMTVKNVLDAVTPGVYISLMVGGLIYLVSPIMLGIAFALSSRMEVGAQQARRALATAFFVLGFLAVVGVLNIPASFGEWWSFVGVWSMLICWLVLLTISLSVRAELKRRAAEHGLDPPPWG